MTEVETIPETAIVWPEPPHLLVEWSSPWQEFKTAFRPALTRSPKALAGEAPIGIFPYRGMLVSWVLEALLLIAVIVLPEHIASLQPFTPPPKPKWDVIYYSGDELPQTQDRGGAQSGKSGRAGGEQAHHRTQTIKVARGDKPGEKIVDAPKLNLPHSDSAVANLLAFKANPGPRPAEGLQSSLASPRLPSLSAVPPTPELNASSTRNKNAISANVVAPAPEIAHANSRNTPALTASPVAPAPNVAQDRMRAANSIATTVVAPAPRDLSKEVPRDLASSRVPVTQTTTVVAPPVSAPTRELAANPRLSLPTPAVVAPPPSEVSHDLNSWGSTRTGDLRSQPVPPPPSNNSAGSLGRSSNGTLASSSAVVPPPASFGNGSGSNGSQSRTGRSDLSGSAAVVPPPPTLGGGKALSGTGRGNQGSGTGGPLDVGSAVSPPTNAGGNSAGNAVVVSSQPGSKVGLPELLWRRRNRHVSHRNRENWTRRKWWWKRNRSRQRSGKRNARRKLRGRQRRHRSRFRPDRPRRNIALSRFWRRRQWNQRFARNARSFCARRNNHHHASQLRSAEWRFSFQRSRTFFRQQPLRLRLHHRSDSAFGRSFRLLRTPQRRSQLLDLHRHVHRQSSYAIRRCIFCRASVHATTDRSRTDAQGTARELAAKPRDHSLHPR